VESASRGVSFVPKGSNRSVTRTLRIDVVLDEFLTTTADRAGVSPSALVNRALRKFVEWDCYAEKFGVVSIPAALVTRLMDYYSEDQARELGRWVGTNHVREFLTFWFKEVTPRTVIQGYPRLASRYGRAFEYEEHADGPAWVIVLKHGGGRKWSLYYEELLKAVFREILQRDATIESTEHQVVARFSLA
jgi:hypothetical protein